MRHTHRPATLLASALLLTLTALPAHAIYKIVGPDGKVTYSDTPPPEGSQAKVRTVAAGGSPSGAPSLANLPTELRRAATQYPVTLYTGKGCKPCDAGRQLLQQRGIPFAEKQVGNTSNDVAAMQQISGSATLPVLVIGKQQLNGLTTADWQSYLDAAGYPRESVLPASYRNPGPTPLVPPQEEAPPPPAAEPAPIQDPLPRASSSPSIRF